MRECLVCYSIRIKDAATGRTHSLLVTAKTFAEEPSADFLNRLPRHLNGTPEFGLPFAYIPEEKIILTAFPNDLKLRNLQKYLGQETIDSVIKEEPGSSFKTTSILNESGLYFPDAIMSYKPERSCLFRYQTVFHEGKDRQKMFGRVYSSHRGHQVFQGMVAIWDSDARKQGRLIVAEPLAYIPEKRMLFQSEVSGVSLTGFVHGDEFSDEEFYKIIKLLASSVAALHSIPERIERSSLPGENLRGRRDTVIRFSRVFPEAASKLIEIIDTLENNCPKLKDDDLSLIHGDLSISQVMVETNQVGLVDFDLICVGDFHQDIASFLVRLENLVDKNILKVETAKKSARVFTQQYELKREQPLVPERLLWNQVAEYVRLSLYIIKQLKPGWRHALMNSINRAEVLIKRMS